MGCNCGSSSSIPLKKIETTTTQVSKSIPSPTSKTDPSPSSPKTTEAKLVKPKINKIIVKK